MENAGLAGGEEVTFENIEVAGVANALHGMRNPMMSHDRSTPEADEELAMRLIRGGSPHRKFLRQVFVGVDICKAPSYWLHEFATYKVGTTLDCSSTMHKIMSRPLTADDFEAPETAIGRTVLGDVLQMLNLCRDGYVASESASEGEGWFLDMKRMLPGSYLYERMTWTANYEVLANIWKWRHNHRLPVWRTFCTDFIEKLPHANWILEAARQ